MYLETIKENIGGTVLVAGFVNDMGFKELANYFEKPIKWPDIKKHCNKFVAIQSDNDEWVPVKHGSIFKEKLGAKVIVEHDKNHFSGSDNVFELPSALESILKMSSKKKS